MKIQYFEPIHNFIDELENNILPFWDILLINQNNKFDFKIHKNSLIKILYTLLLVIPK